MAFEEQVVGSDISMRGSSNVSALTWTGNPPAYSSGGIPQYAVVTQDTATNIGDVILATVNTVMPLGVAQDGPATGPGQSVRVRTAGITKAIAGGAITIDQTLMVNGSGQVVAATAPGATNFFVIGKALTTATQAGDVVSVLLTIGATQYVNV